MSPARRHRVAFEAALLVAAVCYACSQSDDTAAQRDAAAGGAASGGTEAGGSAGAQVGGSAGSPLGGSGGSAGADAGGAAGSDTDADASSCTGALEDVKKWMVICPDSFVQAQNLCSWAAQAAPSVNLHAGSCDGLAVASLDLLPTSAGLQCYYDPSSAKLVGARQWEDTPWYCGGTSWDVIAGEVPASCSPDQLGPALICPPDGGPSDGGTD